MESVLARRHGRLDLAYIRRQLPPLLEFKDDRAALGKLERLMAEVDRRLTP